MAWAVSQLAIPERSTSELHPPNTARVARKVREGQVARLAMPLHGTGSTRPAVMWHEAKCIDGIQEITPRSTGIARTGLKGRGLGRVPVGDWGEVRQRGATIEHCEGGKTQLVRIMLRAFLWYCMTCVARAQWHQRRQQSFTV